MPLAPEFYTLTGHILLLRPEGNHADAQRWFQMAFDRAGELGTRTPQLRAAIGLCRSHTEPDKMETARQMLYGIYSTFTEGFSAPDLVEARSLLGDVSQDKAVGQLSGS